MIEGIAGSGWGTMWPPQRGHLVTSMPVSASSRSCQVGSARFSSVGLSSAFRCRRAASSLVPTLLLASRP